MGDKSNRPIDPLADLFSNVQLTGLSKPKSKRSTLEPLQIDLPAETTERTPPVLENAQSGFKQPKRPLGTWVKNMSLRAPILSN